MRISHRHRFVFLAVPRTGSTTVRRLLDEYSDIKSVHILERRADFPFYHHISARELKAIFDQRGWNWFDYKRFCVIRNPFDRLVSLYHHRQKVLSGGAPARGFLYNASRYVRYRLTPTQSFKSYVMGADPTHKMTAPLRDFICSEDGGFLVDDVLKLESLPTALPEYFDACDDTIDLDALPRLNASPGRLPYRSYYDDESRARVEQIYRYEIDRFDYHF